MTYLAFNTELDSTLLYLDLSLDLAVKCRESPSRCIRCHFFLFPLQRPLHLARLPKMVVLYALWQWGDATFTRPDAFDPQNGSDQSGAVPGAEANCC